MNWTEVLTIILSNVAVLAAFFIHLTNRIDRVKESLESKVDGVKENLESKIGGVKADISHLSERMGIMEFQLSQIVPKRTMHFSDNKGSDNEMKEAR